MFSQSNEDQNAGKIFLGGLSWETTVDDLRDHFERYGNISDCIVSTDPNTGRSKGFGFVTFSDTAAVDQVLSDTHTIQGRSIEPQRAKARSSRGGFGGGGRGGGRDPVKKLFIAGIDDDMSESDIENYFASFGPVQNVHMPVDRATGERRNFCFVEFESESDAERALANDQHNIAGRDVDVKKAKSDQNRGGRGGSRGGYGGGRGGFGGGGRFSRDGFGGFD